MSATNDDTKSEATLSDLIRKEIGRPLNRRHLARLPAFAPDCKLPDRLATLLGDLDRAEAGKSDGPH